MIGAQPVTPLSQSRPPFWVWNIGLKQLYMSAYHLTPDNIPSYLIAMRKFRVQYLWGHSSALEALAVALQRQPSLRPDLQVVLSSSEPLTRRQRARVSAGFGCPVRETYGMSEMVAAASECSEGRLHLWPEAGVSETLHGAEPTSAGEAGDLVATCLLNEAMPLVRYRVGDRMVLDGTGKPCPCGRHLPVIRAIEGRISDMLFTAAGARISPSAMEAIFDFDAPLAESQIVQESINRLLVRYVPLSGRDEAFERRLCDRIRERMGDVDIQVEVVPEIPRGPNGKFRAVICKLNHRQAVELTGRRDYTAEDSSCARTA
jgi:phenylacetate-CoA ligase